MSDDHFAQPNHGHGLFVVAVRMWKGEHYRTRYYTECRDGRPRVSDKQSATRFTEEEVAAVVRQLNALDAFLLFVALEDGQRPDPKAWEATPRPGTAPEQITIDESAP